MVARKCAAGNTVVLPGGENADEIRSNEGMGEELSLKLALLGGSVVWGMNRNNLPSILLVHPDSLKNGRKF